MSSDLITDTEVLDVRVSSKTLWRHVVLKTRSGLVGIGEATLDAAPEDFARMLGSSAQSLIGTNTGHDALADLEHLLDEGLAGATAYSAIDQALSDLAMQVARVPLYAGFGEECASGTVPLYANINRATDDRTPQGFARSASAAADEGFTALKIAPFDGLTPSACDDDAGRELIRLGLERVASVRAAVPDAELRVDCHWRFNVRQAERAIDALSELGVAWFECPLPETQDEIPALVELRRRANDKGMRLAGLETFARWPGFEPYIRSGAYDVVMPDVKHAGGYEAICDIAHRARQAGAAVSLHNPSGPIAHQASVHLSAAIGGEERLEFQWNESPLFFEITDPAPVIEGGNARLTEAHGLGVRLRDDLRRLDKATGT